MPTYTTLQADIDAMAAAGGGKIHLLAGTYTNNGDRIDLKDKVTLIGQGPGVTIIPPVQHNAGGTRVYNLGIEDLTIDGNLNSNRAISLRTGIDWRNVTRGNIRNVEILAVNDCVSFSGSGTYYNSITDVMGVFLNNGIIMLSGANQCTVQGGNFGTSVNGATAIALYGVNGTTIIGTSAESSATSFSAILLTGDALTTTSIVGLRHEHSGYGPAFISRFP